MSMARLWKGEVGAHVMLPSNEHPWDICPIVGISRKLGFVFLDFLQKDGRFAVRKKLFSKTTEYREHETLVIHESRLDELEKCCLSNHLATIIR